MSQYRSFFLIPIFLKGKEWDVGGRTHQPHPKSPIRNPKSADPALFRFPPLAVLARFWTLFPIRKLEYPPNDPPSDDGMKTPEAG